MKIFNRLLGTVLFRSAIYREIAENANLWSESMPLVAVLAIANSLLYIRFNGLVLQSVTRLINPLISWALLGYLSSFFIKRIYQLDLPLAKIMKVVAYAQVPGSLGLLIITWIRETGPSVHVLSYFLYLAVGVSAVEEVFGIRETSQTTTGRAIIVFAISLFVGTLLIAIVDGIIGLL